MRVLVCGGRDYREWDRLVSTLDDVRRTAGRDFVVIHGGAHGTDALAHKWAVESRVNIIEYNANWRGQGRAAGPIRNQRMIDDGKPDLVVAFPGGRGTADMVRRAKAAGIKVVEVEELRG